MVSTVNSLIYFHCGASERRSVLNIKKKSSLLTLDKKIKMQENKSRDAVVLRLLSFQQRRLPTLLDIKCLISVSVVTRP
jgi:hypothetical protein